MGGPQQSSPDFPGECPFSVIVGEVLTTAAEPLRGDDAGWRRPRQHSFLEQRRGVSGRAPAAVEREIGRSPNPANTRNT
jgi:hypothetical protein